MAFAFRKEKEKTAHSGDDGQRNRLPNQTGLLCVQMLISKPAGQASPTKYQACDRFSAARHAQW
jgi:hypothetical protein